MPGPKVQPAAHRMRPDRAEIVNGLGKIWCPGAESNHRHRDFQSRALPTELPGRIRGKRKVAAIRARALGCPALPHASAQARLFFGRGRNLLAGLAGGRTGDAIRIAEPVQKVAILATLAAKGCVRGEAWLAAERTGRTLAGRGVGRHIEDMARDR